MKLRHLIVYFHLLLLIITGCSRHDVYPENEDNKFYNESYQVARLSITTENQAEITTKTTYINCIVQFESDKEEWNFTADARIRGRGNSTWLWYPKKPYRIKLNEKASILGLPSDKDWVLLANYRDPTHLMNTFVFNVGQGLNLAYTNHTRYIEVTLNDDYIGLYQLTEQVEQGANRVAVDKEEGLLLSLDADDGPHLAPDETDNFWSAIYNMPVCVKHPDIENVQQLNEIKGEFAKLEEVIRNADYSEVNELLDIPSFIDYMIIQELVYNVEVAAPRSIYIHKDKNAKWTMGPLWDFDAGFDFDWSTMYTGHNFFNNYKKLVLGTSPVDHIGGYYVPSFFTDLFKSRQFVLEYKNRWEEIKDLIMSEYWPATMLYADEFKEAMQREKQRWPIDKNNQTEIERMENWITNRISYLTSIINNYPSGTK